MSWTARRSSTSATCAVSDVPPIRTHIQDGPYLRLIQQVKDAYPDSVEAHLTGKQVSRLRKSIDSRPEIIEATYRAGVATLWYIGSTRRT